MSNQIIKLNVGGTVFQTSKSTLTKFDGFFRTILDTGVPVTKDDSGAIFIDRSPKHFELILNYMRDGKMEFPKSIEKVKEIRNEADFYLMTNLVKLCDEKLPVCQSLPTLRHIKNDQELLEITANPNKTVLIFAYPVPASGILYCTQIPKLLEVIEPYKDQLDLYFKAFPVERPNRVGFNNLSEWSWLLRKGTRCLQSTNNFMLSLEQALGPFISDVFVTIDPPTCTITAHRVFYTYKLTNQTALEISFEANPGSDGMYSVSSKSGTIKPFASTGINFFNDELPENRSYRIKFTIRGYYAASDCSLIIPSVRS